MKLSIAKMRFAVMAGVAMITMAAPVAASAADKPGQAAPNLSAAQPLASPADELAARAREKLIESLPDQVRDRVKRGARRFRTGAATSSALDDPRLLLRHGFDAHPDEPGGDEGPEGAHGLVRVGQAEVPQVVRRVAGQRL